MVYLVSCHCPQTKDIIMASEKFRLKLIESLNILFYITMLIGCLPYSFLDYRNRRIVNATILALIFVSLNTIHIVVEYHLVSLQFIFNDTTTGSLTKIIGICLLYFEPLMLIVDVIGFVINRHIFVNCLTRMERIDDKLIQENIFINYTKLRRLSIVLIGIVTTLEVFISVFNIFVFRENESLVQSLWLLTNLFPVYFSSLSKIWFIILVFNIRQKFTAINVHLAHTQKYIDNAKGRLDQLTTSDNDDYNTTKDYRISGYLHKEIYGMIGKKEVTNKRKNRHVYTRNKIGILQVMPAIVGINSK